MIDDEYGDHDAAVEVVLLRADPDRHAGAVTPVRGTTSLDLAGTEVTASTLQELVESSSVLTAPDGVPPEVVAALRATPVPPVFAESPWLRQHRALVLRNGQCAVAGHVLNYEPELGVYVDGDL